VLSAIWPIFLVFRSLKVSQRDMVTLLESPNVELCHLFFECRETR
jgi:hypothetical protein